MKLRSECRVNFFHLLVDYVKNFRIFIRYELPRNSMKRSLYLHVGRWNAISQKFRATIVLKFADGDFSKELFIICIHICLLFIIYYYILIIYYMYLCILLHFLKN